MRAGKKRFAIGAAVRCRGIIGRADPNGTVTRKAAHMARRKKKALPQLLLWDRRQQARFIESVERLQGLVGDLEVLLAAPKRRRAAAIKTNETRKADTPEVVNGLPT
jgi:hypothetical protein